MRRLQSADLADLSPSHRLALSEEAVLDLDAFCSWLQETMRLCTRPCPDDELRRDLGLDDFQIMTLVAAFDRLISDHSVTSRTVYEDIAAVRDLHLHYLYAISAPPGSDV